MKKIFFVISLVLLLVSCKNEDQQEILLKSDRAYWIGYQGIFFERELLVYADDSIENVILTKKISENDEIRVIENNKILYTTKSENVGEYFIEGKIKTNKQEFFFKQEIMFLPRWTNDIASYNTENHRTLKLNEKNKIYIRLSVPKKFLTISTDNGTIRETEERMIYEIIPDKIGNCNIAVEVDKDFSVEISLENQTIQYSVVE